MPVSLQRIATSTLIVLAAGPLFVTSSSAGTEAEVKASTRATANNSDSVANAVANAINLAMGDEAKDVKVSGTNGTVTLSGWVAGPDQASQARYIAAAVPGVTNAFSRLRTWGT